MAAPRKSATALAAREKALLKAAEISQRHEQLLGLAAEYFVQQEVAAHVLSEAESKARKLMEQAERDAQDARRGAAKIIAQMLDTGESKAAIAMRLDLTPTKLKKALQSLEDPKMNDSNVVTQHQEA